MMKFGEKGDVHDIIFPDYAAWGRAGTVSFDKSLVNQTAMQEVSALLAVLNVSLEGYHLISQLNVAYYQGVALPEANAILWRFERLDGKNSGLGGEHISILYDQDAKRLLGMTRMQAKGANSPLPSHQQALTAGLNFLKVVAPDLLTLECAIPDVIDLPVTDRIDFVPAVNLDNLHLHWIGAHNESLMADGKQIDVCGMKVKMQIPGDELYAWLVMDEQAEVQTFERTVSWDFAAMQRQTQMWLHDAWLKTL